MILKYNFTIYNFSDLFILLLNYNYNFFANACKDLLICCKIWPIFAGWPHCEIDTHTHTHTHLITHTCTPNGTQSHTHTHTHPYTHSHTHAHAHTHAQTHTHAHTHTHTHRHAHTLSCSPLNEYPSLCVCFLPPPPPYYLDVFIGVCFACVFCVCVVCVCVCDEVCVCVCVCVNFTMWPPCKDGSNFAAN